MSYNQNTLKRYILATLYFYSLSIIAQDATANLESLLNASALDLSKAQLEEKTSSGEDLSIDTSDQSVQEPTSKENDIFGIDFINSIPKSISATSDLPLPNDYEISINDKLRFILSGQKTEIYDLQVGLDGSVLFPDIGKIQLAGESFKEIKSTITNLVDITYVGVSVDISITELSARKISIVGAVKAPGTYLVNPFTTLTNALAYSGGFEDYGSLRNVVLIRDGKRTSYDFYDFLIYGDRRSDINIRQGDTLLVQGTNQHLSLEGEVFRPKKYEYLPSDTFGDIIAFGVGLTGMSNIEEVNIVEEKDGILVSSNIGLDEKINERTIRTVSVGKKSIASNLDIKVSGSGVEERLFSSIDYKYLADVIEDLKFSQNIYPYYAKISQDSKNGIEREVASFSLIDKDTYQNISLKDNVEILFFSREEIDSLQKRFLNQLNLGFIDTIEQFSWNEGEENFQEIREIQSIETNQRDIEAKLLGNIRLNDLKVLSFGGDSYIAPVTGKVTPKIIFNFFGRDQDFEENLVTATTRDGLIENAANILLDSKLLTQINFPEQKTINFLLKISGQVKNPGIFSISSSVTLEEAYNIAGGFTEKADVRSIIFLRKKLADRQESALVEARSSLIDVIISQLGDPLKSNATNFESLLPIIQLAEDLSYLGRLTGNLAPGAGIARNIIIEPGDEIIVPSKSSSVTIIGEVLNPTSTSFVEGLTVKGYLDTAGNLSSYADKNNIYVIKTDGTSEPIKYRNIAKYRPEPGDTIIIPRDLQKLNTVPLISTSVKIISDIAFAAASLNALRN